MTTRRSFIKVLAAIPPVLSYRPLWAAAASSPDPTRLALVIGNSAYQHSALANPANDAKAVAGLFTQAGFTVDSRLDATRTDMLAAIERFGTAAKRSDTRLVVFYYAGHGAQLDWRNYLLPVDAVVEKQEHMKQRCVDLGLLLGQFSAAKDKTFIVILDACRNNPFGRYYQPEQKGLSQFDAPVGSLLAYATSPGNVASDGAGANGLYTENLVRELSHRNTRIEDALKRVRLNVRLASHGEQIPWETTSLETDVFVFSEGQKKFTEAEMEQMVEADVTEWARIKSSKKIDDWVTYLRNFPNGRFAEIAQMRLTRLLAEIEKGAAEKRQREEQKRLDDERIERERIRVAEEQRLAAERKRLEEQQRQELRRREEEQQRLEARNRAEQERLERDRQRIAEAERLAEERRKQEEQRLLAEQKRLALEAERRRQEDLRQQEEQRRLSEQRRLEQEHLEQERLRLAEVQRLAAERKQIEEQQLQERRRRDEQQGLEARNRMEQDRLERERQRIAEAERLAEDRRKQEEQRLLAEQRRLALEAEKRRQEELKHQEEQQRVSELKRLDQERQELERTRVAEAQRLAAERKQLEQQQLQEQRRRQEEQQGLEARHRQEQEGMERERQRITEAERAAEERKQLDRQRQLAEQQRIEQQRLERQQPERLEAERMAAQRQEVDDGQTRLEQEKPAFARPEPAATMKPTPVQAASAFSAAPAAAPGPAAGPQAEDAATRPRRPPMLDIREGATVPLLIAPSANPYSAGRYPLTRIYSVGDFATIRQSDILTGLEEHTRTARVTRVDYDDDRVEYNRGMIITDLMGNALKTGPIEYETPLQWTPGEFHVGRKWTAAVQMTKRDRESNAYYDMKITKRETISVPAGSFDTFRIEGEGWNTTLGARLEVKLWLVPGLNFPVKREQVIHDKKGRFRKTERQELVALRQRKFAL